MEYINTKDILLTDSETFCTVDLKKCGAARYAEEVEVILAGFKLNGLYDHYDFSIEGSVVPQWVYDHIDDGGMVAAHNAVFDFLVYKKLLPNLKIEQMIDTAAWCSAAGLPAALGKATAVLGQDVGKYAGGSSLITKFCMPRKPSKHNKSTRNMPADFPDHWAEFRDIYLKADIDSMEELMETIPPLIPSEQQVWVDTQTVSLAGIPIDLDTVNLIKDKLVPMIDQESSNFIRIVGLFPTQRDKVLGWVRSQGVKILNMQADTVAGVLADPKAPDNVKKALEHRANTTHMSFKKYDTMLNAVCKDGTVKGTLQYHAAGTGRFGGRLLQPQNLTRGTIDGEEAVARIQGCEFNIELVKSAVRPMIYHPDGLTICDWSGIEARVVQWLCQDENALDVFRRGEDPYVVMATKIYGKEMGDITKDERFIGKQAILGLGYQMSAKKFVSMVENYGETISMEDAKLAVEVYRKEHSKLKTFWDNINGAAILAIQKPGDTIRLNSRISFEFSNRWLHMILPSGRKIAYFEPNLEHDRYGLGLSYMSMNEKNQYIRTHTYGGKLVENAVQAIARDILVISVRALLEKGYRILTHVHDEIIVAGHHLKEIERIMCVLPEWAEGLPLDAEGAETQRYKKI